MGDRRPGRGRGNPWHKNPPVKQENKFATELAKIQASIQKHLDKEVIDSSSGEEDLAADPILESLAKTYSQFGGTTDDLKRTQQFLENSFQSGAVVCLICISSIKRAEPIWNCIECYGFLHLTCVQKWAKDSLFQQKQLLEEHQIDNKKIRLSWPCPKCRHDYKSDDIPNKYICFCGKVEDPLHHPWLVPHSCGETCGRPLQPLCGHSCLLLCHPGPCPPCPKTVKSACYCGKQPPRPQRCCNKVWSCGSPCGTKLKCNKHQCEQPCHPGDCPPCPRESVQRCDCGSKQMKRPCAVPNWQCEKVCGQPFLCGNHVCNLVCHKGYCGVCPLTLQRSCPCGKSTGILPCEQELPTCNDSCMKLLACGAHYCSQKCHKGECGMCLEIVSKVCRCGSHKKEVPCQKDYYCETKCKQMKDCFRHFCNRKCCDGQCPPCEKPCGRTLKCGNHKCPSVCHRGPCYPCSQVAQVKCHCGGTVLTVPCGRQRKTKPPRCNRPCIIPPDCHHSSRDKHHCHFGDCPPCRQICNKVHSSCKHSCPVICHDAIWSKVEDNHKAAGPWEKTEAYVIKKKFPCPDCIVPELVVCLGGHEATTWPCYLAKPSSCHRICGRQLECNNHVCQKLCHTVSNAQNNTEAGTECDVCNSECTKPRPTGCSHRCPQPCHAGPCPPCNLMNKVRCHCGLNILYRRCGELYNADEETRRNLMSCGIKCPKNYPCGHRCRNDCHPNSCTGAELCKKKVKLNCTCGRIKSEFTCDYLRKMKCVVECDDICKKQMEDMLKAIEEEKKKKNEVEERKNKEELEKFEKKLHGRKKQRERNRSKEEVEKSFLAKYWIVLLSAAVGVTSTLYFLFH